MAENTATKKKKAAVKADIAMAKKRAKKVPK